MTRELSLLQDPTLFSERFDDLTEFVEQVEGWRIAKKELTDRKVLYLVPSVHCFYLMFLATGGVYERL